MIAKKHDIVVLGSGLAGLRAAIAAAQNLAADVAIISKAQLCMWSAKVGQFRPSS